MSEKDFVLPLKDGASKAIHHLSSLKNPFEVVSIEKVKGASRFLHRLVHYIRLNVSMHMHHFSYNIQ